MIQILFLNSPAQPAVEEKGLTLSVPQRCGEVSYIRLPGKSDAAGEDRMCRKCCNPPETYTSKWHILHFSPHNGSRYSGGLKNAGTYSNK
jgi:hypothetical protein